MAVVAVVATVAAAAAILPVGGRRKGDLLDDLPEGSE